MAGVVITLAGLLVAVATWLYPNFSSRPAPTSEREPYVRAVEEVCRQGLVAVTRLGRPPLNDPVAYGQHTLRANEIRKRVLASWAAVPAPERDRETLRRILDNVEAIVFESEEIGRLLVSGDTDRASPIINRGRELQRLHRQEARAYGFRSCMDL